MNPSLRFRTAFAMTMLLGFAVASAAEYPIRFDRPLEAGQEYRLQEKGSTRDVSRVFLHGQLSRQEDERLDAEIEARVRVLEVNEIGLPKQLSLTIEHFAFGDDGELTESLARGVVVTARQESDKTVFRVEGKRLPELASEALGLFFSTTTEDIPEEDALLGTSVPRSVGESWEPNREVYADFFRTRGLRVDVNDIQGTVKLEAVEQVEGVECLRLRAEMTLQNASLVDLPPGASMEGLTMTQKRTSLLPTDLNTGTLAFTSSIESEMRTRFSEGPTAGLEVHRITTETDEARIFRFDPEIERSGSGGPIYRHEARDREWSGAEHSGEHLEEIEAHIENHIGKIETVYHELVSDLVHLDVLFVAATETRPYHVLVTSGVSELPMRVPEGLEALRRVELLIILPADWPLTEEAFKDEANYWPVRWLKHVGRLPHEYDTWIGWGHTIPNGDPPKPIANTEFVGVVLLEPHGLPPAVFELPTKSGESILLYAVVPLYREEMDLKLDKGVDEIEKRFDKRGVGFVLDTNRPNVGVRRDRAGAVGRAEARGERESHR